MTKVLIAGAGIAGSAAAIALRKAGIDAALYEAYPEPDADGPGAFLTLAANGQDALHAIDAGQLLDSVSFPVTRLRFLNPDGTVRGEFPLGSKRPAPRTVKRAALAAALAAEATRLGATSTYGKRLTEARRDGTGISVSFADGASASGDVLIGADGIHSAVRGIIAPDAPSPRYTGLVIATGYADSSPGAPDEAGTSTMIFGSRAYLGCIAAPDGRRWWFSRLPAPEPSADDLAAPDDRWRDRLTAALDGDPTPAADIIRATPGPVTVTSARDLGPLPAWGSGPMVLAGDAAHAASPTASQGAALALEDAVTLARCLRDVRDTSEALAAYEHLRRDRAERVARGSAGTSANPAPPAPGTRMEGPPVWLLDHHIEWNEPISIPS